jgi:endonuclease YncB( thermonuclease family)
MHQAWRFWTAPIQGLFCCVVLAALTAAAMPGHAAERPAPCQVNAATTATVAAVADERTLRLADGTELRLAGLEGLSDAGDTTSADAAAIHAKAALQRLALGKTVAVESLGEDRYGRRIALVALTGDPAGPSLQERLIARGEALVAARIGLPGCTSRFLDAERGARAARLGLWADPHYLIREAGRPDVLTAAYGRFALVEGKVLSVNDRGATVYVNFGRRWSEEFHGHHRETKCA